ncbi:amidohydrolase [Serinibacter arcticus]|uniref:Amidohydrolase n=1 Tax=Serinibacter arcticus TaxID=1655435 RepID=A0A2U1ZZJ8_9MICO|nr:amidohydrolase [Serinibacter arcticus]
MRPTFDRIDKVLAERADRLLEVRREIHAFPEVAWTEHRTSELVYSELTEAGLSPRRVGATGIVCDLPGSTGAATRRRIGLRADLDALPIPEETGLPYASTRSGISHACGHDVHTASVLGAGLALADLSVRGELPVGVRLVFQPAEEVQPGGAETFLQNGVIEGVEQIYAVHCDPKIEVGTVGSRIGSITSASDPITVTLRSHGGHTSRPHMTGDVVYALGQVIAQASGVLGRRMDPRAGVNLTWGAVHAGNATNAIPTSGTLMGTLRVLDVEEWARAGEVLDRAITQIVAPYGVEVEVNHVRGVPPTVNEASCVAHIEEAASDVVGEESVHLTEQSLGGEDFGWYLHRVPGAMVRLGVRTPGAPVADLHRADLVVDERAIVIGARMLARTAVIAGTAPAPAPLV